MGAKTNNRCPCSLSEVGGGQAGALNGVRVGTDPGSGLRGGLGGRPHPLGGAVCRVHAQYPALLPTPQKWQLGFWSFCILFIICPNGACTQLFLVPYRFFVFCCSRRRLSRWKHCSKGSQVPACLLSIRHGLGNRWSIKDVGRGRGNPWYISPHLWASIVHSLSSWLHGGIDWFTSN